jgi:Icc-related predicted phosphoesterase
MLCGDLTDFGLVEEAKILAEDLSFCRIPVLGVLGNHDVQNNRQVEIRKILADSKMLFIDEEAEIVGDCGFVGVKGFGGGFGSHMLASFGEDVIKQFVAESVKENLLLENLLRSLQTKKNVVMLHYSPTLDTVKGEPPEIYHVLGTSRLAETIDRFEVNAVIHGHSHYGAHKGKTQRGIPVYNCALSVLRREFNKDFFLLEI